MQIKNTFENSFSAYRAALDTALASVSEVEIDRAVELIHYTMMVGRTIYVCGNGGSSSIADMLSAVWMKWVNQNTPQDLNPRVISLSCNTPLITAIANDIGYEEVFAYQLKSLMQTNDLLVTVSSSGNSPNIRRAIETCQEFGNSCIAFSGFNGGASNLADINLHVDSFEYCLVEDAHFALSHFITRNIIYKENNT